MVSPGFSMALLNDFAASRIRRRRLSFWSASGGGFSTNVSIFSTKEWYSWAEDAFISKQMLMTARLHQESKVEFWLSRIFVQGHG